MWITSASETKEANNITGSLGSGITSAQRTTVQSGDSGSQTKSVNGNNKDTVEISSEAYKLQSDQRKMSASSGKDILGITRKGKTGNTFVIHFTDSAQVSRMLQRGYFTVNGIRIDLSDEMKERLETADKQAQAEREKVFALQTLEHNMAVVQQQKEAMEKVTEDTAKALETARRIAKGGQVPAIDEKKLMEYSMDMYMMAKNIAAMNQLQEKLEKYKSLYEDEEEPRDAAIAENISEYTPCEVQMSVSLEDSPQIIEISV